MNLLGLDDDEPMPELCINTSVGEASSTDPDALQHTVAGELVHHQGGVQQARRLVVVGDNTTDEVRVGGIQCCEEGFQLGSEGRRDGLVRLYCIFTFLAFLLLCLLLWLAWMVAEEVNNQSIF